MIFLDRFTRAQLELRGSLVLVACDRLIIAAVSDSLRFAACQQVSGRPTAEQKQ